ncbi:MAG TPA: DUF502 domain-containing protein [Bacteroidales bacterium]|nr:DUF502 domain-containing protein [Bacteroidales bacterium]
MKRVGTYFLQGLIYIAPLGLTIYIIFFLFTFLDGLVSRYIDAFIGFHIPGIGLLALLLVITLLGIVGQSIFFRPLRVITDRLIKRTPLLSLIYSSISDLLKAFVGKEKKFNHPVLVKVNTISELEKVGFLTQEDLTDLGIKDKVAVYFPHSYNFSGELFIVPAEHIRPFNMRPAEAMKFIVSGGVAKN